MSVGYIHSVESFGAVDGPGVRFVTFLQGCPLRCLYCHNPDTWKLNEGTKSTSDELFDQIKQYKNYIQNGGATFSGGEPLLQAEFLLDVVTLCKREGIHTAIDTAGAVPLEAPAVKELLELADLILLDIKDIDKQDCITLTGQDNANAMAILNHCDYVGTDVWIRHVLLPNYTMNVQKLHRLGRVLSWYGCIKKVELIPFHKLGEYKWDYIDTPYILKEISPTSDDEIEQAKEVLMQYGLCL